MSRLRRILGAIRGTIGWLNLPFDIQTLWNFFRRWILPSLSASLSAGAVIVLGYFREAPFWQVALWAILAFAIIYVLVFFLVKAAQRRKSAGAHTEADAPAPSVRTARAVSTQSEDVGESYGPPPQSPMTVAQLLWREQIKEWRSVIPDYDLDRTDDRQRFLKTDTYSQMREHLRPEVVEMFEAQRTHHVGNEARGDTAYTYTLLDEVDRIERERVFGAPKSITNQSTPGELKALCSHLADELEHEDELYKDSEEAIRLWRVELEAQGVPESEIDEKVAVAGDENLRGTLKRYNKHLKSRLLKLYDTLGSRGWFGDVDRSRIEGLWDPYDMRRLAKRLREVCRKLPDS